MLDVSSLFLEELQKRESQPCRKIFLDISTWDASSNYVVNSVDVTDRIIKWPILKLDWNAFRPNNCTFQLANEDQQLNRLHNDSLHLVHDCVVVAGFTKAQMIDEPFFSVDVDSCDWTFTAANSGFALAGSDWLEVTSNNNAALNRATNKFVSVNSYSLTNQGRFELRVAVSSFTAGEISFGFGVNQDSYYFTGSLSGVTPATYGNSFYATSELYIDAGSFGVTEGVIQIDAANDDTQAFINQFELIAEAGKDEACDTNLNFGEYVQLFQGNIHRIRFNKGKIDLSVTDKWNKLSRIVAGTDETPLDYTGSDYMAHDLFWYLCTSAGGLSAVESTSNPDIDYSAYLDFVETSSRDNLIVKAHMSGEKISENLARFGRITDSSIYVDENNKLTIKRFSLADTEVVSLTNDHLIGGMDFVFDETNINNRVYATADYNVDSDSFATTVVEADSSSVNSFGLYEKYYDDDVIWFVGSTSALSLCQRRTNLYGLPNEEVMITTPMLGMMATVGDFVHIGDTLIDIDSTYRVLYKEIDLDKLIVKMRGHRATALNAFTLDVSTLDGTDVLT